MFFEAWDEDEVVIHNMNKKYMLSQLKPFNNKLMETRIQMVELYAWV